MPKPFHRWWTGLLTMVLILCPLRGSAYVMQGAHLLDLMVDRLGRQHRGIGVTQTLILPGAGLDTPPVTLAETVTYRYPNRFRAEIRSSGIHHLHVYAHGGTLIVKNGRIVSSRASRFDHYKTPLLFRTRSLLQQHLGQLGIDTGRSSFGRLDGNPVYVFGAQYPDLDAAQLWLDQRSFYPVRLWLVAAAGGGSVDIRFERWRLFDKHPYPSRIVFYQNGQIGRQIEVKRVTSAPVLDDRLFDITSLRSRYAAGTGAQYGAPDAETKGEIQQTIENFKNMYDGGD